MHLDIATNNIAALMTLIVSVHVSQHIGSTCPVPSVTTQRVWGMVTIHNNIVDTSVKEIQGHVCLMLRRGFNNEVPGKLSHRRLSQRRSSQGRMQQIVQGDPSPLENLLFLKILGIIHHHHVAPSSDTSARA